ncbi:MAG: Mrp/NBP35 family ATP-binding protein [Desulfovibrionaceae bacterium]|jgi:Mrp family chromosome partitioning ATPase|nr:Mrp/NBP35 family ATP-binding protein [Desulfovibrionaceae bacterium]
MSSSCKTCASATGCSSAAKNGDGPCPSGEGATSRKKDDAAVKLQDQIISSTLSRIRYKLFIMSGKGGVGKSSVTVNVAAALAARGFRVGILDVDIHGPSVPNLLGLTGGLDVDTERGNLIKPKPYNDNLSAVSMDSLLKDRDQAVLWRGPMKHSAIRQFISDVNWGDLDFLVIDSPPGTGDEHMTVLKTIPDALCVIVTTPQEISLADVRKAVNFLQYAQASVLGVVENMSGLVCPHCGGEISLFKKGGGKELAAHYGIEFLGAVPLDPATVVAGDLGKPVVFLDEDTPAKTAFLALADRIADATENSLEAASTIHT